MVADVASKPNHFMFNKGDNLDSILPNDKRFNICSSAVRENIFTPQDQADNLIKDLWGIKDRILALGAGNHEMHLANMASFSRYLADRLGCPDGGYTYKLICKDLNKDLLFRIFATHGSGSLPNSAPDLDSLEGRQKAALRRKLGNLRMSDSVYATMGHTHKLVVSEPTVRREINLTDNGHNQVVAHDGLRFAQNSSFIPENFRWYGCSGSFLNTFTAPGLHAVSYSEAGMFGPAPIGYIKVHVQAGEIVHVETVRLA
jgi:hypothetical protein